MHLFRALSSFCGAPSIERTCALAVTVLFGLIPLSTFSQRSSSSRRRAHHLHLRAIALIIFFAPPHSSSSSRRRAHHLHLRAAAPIIFTFALPRPSSSSSRRRAHHLHLRAAAPIIFFALPRSSSSSSRRRNHHASAPRSSFIWRLGKFYPPAPPSLHSFGSSVNSIHPRRHLFIRLAAQ